MAGLAVQYSGYYNELVGEAKSRYEQKVMMFSHVDPYHCQKAMPVALLPQWNGLNGLKLCMLTFITF